MAEELQAIYIRSYSPRSTPSPHIVYPVEVHAVSSKSWTVWRRYSSFVALHSDLSREADAPPPAKLPSKHGFSRLAFWQSSAAAVQDDDMLQDRREGLERYLRSILTHRDSRWRTCRAFKEFVALPVGEPRDHLRRRSKGDSGPSNVESSKGSAVGRLETDFTSSSWIDEQSALLMLCREIRSDLNKRDQLAASSPSDSQQISVQGKKKLASLVNRTSILAKGLDELGKGGMPQGELRRRTDLLSEIQDEITTLGTLSVSSRNKPAPSRPSQSSQQVTNEVDPQLREELIPKDQNRNKPGRALGVKAKETEATRHLDNTGLLSLQQELFQGQDSRLESLSAAIRRQRELGMAINNELQQQNELLEGLDKDVESTEVRLKKSSKEVTHLGGNK